MKDFTVTVTNPERAADWQAMLGSTTVFILSPIPVLANLPGKPHAQVYLLDLEALTPEQTDRLIAYLAQKFSIPESEVARGLPTEGVPILADDCIVTVLSPQRWFD